MCSFPKRFSTQLSFAVYLFFFCSGVLHPTFQIDVNSHSPVKKMPFQEKNLKKKPKKIYAVYIYLSIYGILSTLNLLLFHSSHRKKKKRTLIIKAASVGIHINGEDSKDQGGNAQHHSQHWDHVVLGMPFHLVVQVVPHPALCARISRWFNLETSYPNKLDIWISYVSLKNHEDIWNKKTVHIKILQQRGRNTWKLSSTTRNSPSRCLAKMPHLHIHCSLAHSFMEVAFGGRPLAPICCK